MEASTRVGSEGTGRTKFWTNLSRLFMLDFIFRTSSDNKSTFEIKEEVENEDE